MALPLIPILLGVAVVGAALAASAGGTPARVEGIAADMNYLQAKSRWNRSLWRQKVDRLRVELTNPDDVAIAVAQEIFPNRSWPALETGFANQWKIWKLIRTDVWRYLGIDESPFPAG
jgi:hypothetical protein